jgi:hypothetical protein
MSTAERANAVSPTDVSPEVRAELEEAIRRAMTGERDPEAMRRASERMDRTREAIRRRQGVVNIAVDLIREARGSLDEEQERELTLTQRALLRRGEVRLRDPETDMMYVLVPEQEYEQLRGSVR